MSAERHRALEMLAGSSLGCTEATPVHGFTIDLPVDLVHEGLATATPETVHARKRAIEARPRAGADIRAAHGVHPVNR
jgi:hypothetical protein